MIGERRRRGPCVHFWMDAFLRSRLSPLSPSTNGMLLSKLPRIPSQVPLARYLSSTTPLLARLRPATRLSPETGATLSPSPPPSSSPPPLPPQQPSAELFDRPPPRALTYEEEELRARKNESRKQRVKEESSIRAELGISRRGRKLKGPVLERSLRDRAGILGVKTAPLPDWKIKQLEKRAAREAAAAGSSGGFLIPDGVSPDTRPSISSEQTRAPKKQWTPPPPKETSWADDEDPNSPVFRPAWANERLTEDVRSSRSYQEQQSTRRSDDEDEPSPLYSPGRSFFDPSPPPTSHASHTHKLASSSPSASTSEPPLSPFEPPTAAPKKRLIPAFTDDSGSFIPPSKPWEKPSITPHLPNRPFVASEPPIHPSWTGTQLPLDPSGQPISVSAYEAALLRKKKVPLQQAAIAGRGLPDRWERCAKIHPMFKQQRGRVEGAFFETRREALEALAERKKLGDTAWKRTLKEKEETRRKEKLKGEVKTKEVDPEAPKPKLSLHVSLVVSNSRLISISELCLTLGLDQINSLSASLTADQLYHDLLSAEFPLLTLELIPNDPLQTAIVELGSDENLIASLKALGEKDTVRLSSLSPCISPMPAPTDS